MADQREERERGFKDRLEIRERHVRRRFGYQSRETCEMAIPSQAPIAGKV
jgi:hypothetical protein